MPYVCVCVCFPVPMDEPSIYEMAEYFSETSKDEPTDKLSNRPVTVIVYHNGDQLNFFRVVDRDSTSPMSESLRYVVVIQKVKQIVYMQAE